MSAHTPGPWTIEPSGYGSIVCKDGKSMVAVWPEGLGGPSFPHEANARLIAAAPELLEALKEIMPAYEARMGDSENVEWNECWNKAVAAIAKATGAAP